MFLAILGALLVLIAVAAMVTYPALRKKADSGREAGLAEAEADYQAALDLKDRWYAWDSERNREAKDELDPDGNFAGLSRYSIEDMVRSKSKVVSDYKTYSNDDRVPTSWVVIGGGIAIAVGLTAILTQCFYRQDIGEAKVQVSWSGQLVGESTTPGFHMKAPWVSVRTFDVRNNLVTYVGASEEGKELPNYAGNVTTGPQITFQDKEGVTGNLDLTLRYSIEPGSVLDIYSDFGTQENFVNKVISEGVRAETRAAPSTKSTLEVYSDKAGLASAIRAGLEKRWEGLGILIEDVAIQETRYSTEVTSRFDEAQAARIAVTKAQAEQEAAKVTAETKVITAQGEANAAVVAAQGQADANELLTKSLTPEVLTQRYIDALKAGTVYVVPEGSTPLITTK